MTTRVGPRCHRHSIRTRQIVVFCKWRVTPAAAGPPALIARRALRTWLIRRPASSERNRSRARPSARSVTERSRASFALLPASTMAWRSHAIIIDASKARRADRCTRQRPRSAVHGVVSAHRNRTSRSHCRCDPRSPFGRTVRSNHRTVRWTYCGSAGSTSDRGKPGRLEHTRVVNSADSRSRIANVAFSPVEIAKYCVRPSGSRQCTVARCAAFPARNLLFADC